MNPFRQAAVTPKEQMTEGQFLRWCEMQENLEKQRTERSIPTRITFGVALVFALCLLASLKGCQMSTDADIQRAKYHADCPK